MYEEICENNQGLLRLMAQRYARLCELDRAVSEEDLIQAGAIGLIRAAQSFDESGGKSWASWAVWHIRREIESTFGLRAGHFTRADMGADSLDRLVDPADRHGMTLGESLADDRHPGPEEAALIAEVRQGIRDALGRLKDEKQRRAVELCRLEGRTYREAAAEMGVSIQRACRLCARGSANLTRDRKLRELADLDRRTRFYAHKGVAAFNRDWTSVTEAAALWRIEQRERTGQRIGN